MFAPAGQSLGTIFDDRDFLDTQPAVRQQYCLKCRRGCRLDLAHQGPFQSTFSNRTGLFPLQCTSPRLVRDQLKRRSGPFTKFERDLRLRNGQFRMPDIEGI